MKKDDVIFVCDDFDNLSLERMDGRGPWRVKAELSVPKSVSEFAQTISDIVAQCCEDHPVICTDRTIFGGSPHFRGIRISVSDILAQIYLLGSVAAVVDYYSSAISADQVREAVAYAQDFFEISLTTT